LPFDPRILTQGRRWSEGIALHLHDMDTAPRVPSVITTSTVVVSIVFLLLSFIAILIRWRARRVARATLNADDLWIVISWILTLGVSVTLWVFASLAGVNYLKGNPEKSLELSTQSLWIEGILLIASSGAVKISILCFYKRIFSVGRFRLVANIAIGVMAVWATVFVFVSDRLSHPIGVWANTSAVIHFQ
jgi:hypothetical protein